MTVNAEYDTASKIDDLFSNDKDWRLWRDTYGPDYLSLTACQVSSSLEQKMISNLTRNASGSGAQTAQGLGAGCRPLSTSRS